jgi:hypothetical protein
VLKQGVVFTTLETQLVLMEKPPGPAHKREYVVLSRRGLGGFRSDLEQHFAAGELLLWMAPYGELQLAILEKTSNVPAQRVFASSKTNDLIAQINEAARQGFRLMQQVGGMGVLMSSTVAYMVSDGTAREYRFLNNKRASMDEFKLAAQSGFHLLPKMPMGSLLTLEKVSGSNTAYVYRISEDKDEIKKMLSEGWTILQVPMPFFGEKHGVVLENAPPQSGSAACAADRGSR